MRIVGRWFFSFGKGGGGGWFLLFGRSFERKGRGGWAGGGGFFCFSFVESDVFRLCWLTCVGMQGRAVSERVGGQVEGAGSGRGRADDYAVEG